MFFAKFGVWVIRHPLLIQRGLCLYTCIINSAVLRWEIVLGKGQERGMSRKQTKRFKRNFVKTLLSGSFVSIPCYKKIKRNSLYIERREHLWAEELCGPESQWIIHFLNENSLVRGKSVASTRRRIQGLAIAVIPGERLETKDSFSHKHSLC